MSITATPRQLLRVREAAEHLGLSQHTLNNWRYVGKGPGFVKIGGSVRYDVADLDNYIEKQRRTSTSDSGAGRRD